MAAVEVNAVAKRFLVRSEPNWTAKDRILNLHRRSEAHEFWALNDVSLEIAEGDTVGLLGHNGSGKSTLLKVIGGILRPDRGSVITRGRLASLLELGAGFHPELSGRENVYLNASLLGLSRRDIEARFGAIVEFSGLERFIDNPVKTYSSGMYVRLGFAVAVNVEPEILLIDEVLAVGDELFQERCLARIREFQRDGRTIVVVTHGVELVRDLCDAAAVLQGGHLIARGDPGECIRRFRDSLHNSDPWYVGADDPGAEVVSARDLTTGRVRIEELIIHHPREAETSLVRFGDPVEVEARWSVPEPLEECAVSFSLFDEAGRVVHSANSQILGVELGELSASGTTSFRIPRLPLLSGAFTVSVGFHDPSATVMHDFVEERLELEHHGPAVGSVGLELDLVHRVTSPRP